MKKIAFISIIVLLFQFLAVPVFAAEDETARNIMEKVEDVDDGDNRSSLMMMILIDKNGSERIKHFRSFSKDYGDDSRQIMFIEDPPGLRNTGFLMYEYDSFEKEDEQWLFLPALGKAKRIASTEKDGSFMGSDLNYSDMNSRNLDDYTYRIVKIVEMGGVKHWLIESLPLDERVIEKTGYKKSIIAVRQDNYLISKIKAVTSRDEVKTIMFENLKAIEGILVYHEIKVVTKEGQKIKHKTHMIFSDVKFNQQLDDSLFTLRRLEKGL